MNNAGRFDLANLQITAARALALLTPISGLEGMSAVTIEAAFAYGSGGATASIIVGSSLDSSLAAWRHIARFDFTTASAVKMANISGLTAKGITAYNDLASEGVQDGFLGNVLAAYVVTTGTYGGSTLLTCRVAVR